MHVLIIGCGAIGSYYAERLLSANVDVTVTARSSHLRALKQNGLTVVHDGETRSHRVSALSHAELVKQHAADDFDVIIIALKATHTLRLISDIGKWLRSGNTAVLSIQNGVDNERLFAELLGENRVWGGLSVQSGGEITLPGLATTTGFFKLIIGPWPYSETLPETMQQLATIWQSQGVPVEVSKHIQKELWIKLIVNNGVNPLSAVEQEMTYTLTHSDKYKHKVFRAMQETARAASYDGVEISDAEVEAMFHLIKTFNSIKTSMLIDLEKGRELELDAILGSVIARCRMLDSPASTTESLWQQLTSKPIPESLDALFVHRMQ